jgi:hypothetical protein
MDILRMTFRLENRQAFTQVRIHTLKVLKDLDLFIADTILKPEPSSLT